MKKNMNFSFLFLIKLIIQNILQKYYYKILFIFGNLNKMKQNFFKYLKNFSRILKVIYIAKVN
jgi:hypothetical protein